MHQEAVVRVNDEVTEPAIIGRGVRQGCLLSPILFSIYAEMMMIEALDGIEEGVLVGGVLLKDIKFADDQAMVASSEDGLQKMMDSLDVTGRRYDMKINVKKTKTMRISRRGGVKLHIEIYGNTVEQVKKFRYLRALVTEDGRCEAEIGARVAMAKKAFNNKIELLTQIMDRS